MPGALGNGNSGQALQHSINQLAPLADSFHGPMNPNPAYVTPTVHQDTGVMASFAHFLGGVAHSFVSIGETVAKWTGHELASMVTAPMHLGEGIGLGLLDRSSLNRIQAQNGDNSHRLDTLNAEFKAGRITNQQYKDGLAELNQEMMNLSREATGLNKKIGLDQKNTTAALIDTAATMVTILTAGLGKATTVALTRGGAVPLGEKTAADWLITPAADTYLSDAQTGLRAAIADPEIFAKLSPSVQYAVQKVTADVLASGTSYMTAGAAVRATAVNLAFKYPVYFSYTSSTAQDIYQKLDDGKYGAAVRSAAFNAMLLLSGGPIGQALKYGGKAVGGVSARMFGKTSFWDELSKYYGDGSASGFRDAAANIYQQLGAKDGEAFIKDLAATEATNMQAVAGDAVAAAARVAEGMKNQRGFGTLTSFTHEEGLLDMRKMSEAQRIADQTGRQVGLGPITVGVVDARSLKGIGEQLGAVSFRSRFKAWETMKKSGANYGWANNENFDKQIKELIRTHRDQVELQNAVLNIKASFYVKGFPTKIAKQLGKMGYLPISPVDLQAPFKEGVGKLSTKFAEGEDYFIKTSQPLPVLGHTGELISRMGLSPNASSERTYQLFNQNVSANLSETEVARSIVTKLGMGGSKIPDDVSDYMLKKLKNHETRLPVRDYRMYTNRDIRAALGVNSSEALEIQKAISKAYFQVPLAVRGLGDRAVDSIYVLRPTRAVTSRYMKIQGALRFSWNPFFQYLRVIPKTEILASAEGGGVLSSVFGGRMGRMGEIRSALHETGAFDKGGFTKTFGAEGEEFLSPVQRNLGKKLLPMQERSISGLIGAQADRMGMDWKQYMNTYPDQVRDTIQMIAEYDRKSNFLNSPLARTLNIAFFPFRFETKVATIFARNLAKADMMTQVATVNGVLRAHEFLTSDEGQTWYAKNADAIGIMKYITPIASLAEVFESLLPGHDHHLGNFGELGGLPFGWIPQLLDAEGLTQFSQPGVNAKTGEPFPKYIPNDTKGQLAIAVQDLIGSLFSYPGATIGAPSKSKVTRTIAQGVTGAHTTDFTMTTPVNLSAQQKDYSAHIQALAGTTPGALSQPPPQPQAPGVAVNPSAPPTPLPRKPAGSGSGKSSKAPKKKKADYVPNLLPGQNTLGQL